MSKEYCPFEEARNFARTLGLKGSKDWKFSIRVMDEKSVRCWRTK